MAAGLALLLPLAARANPDGAGFRSVRADPAARRPAPALPLETGRGTAVPVPTFDPPASVIGPTALGRMALMLDQSRQKRAQVEVSDTGNPAVQPLTWVGLFVDAVSQKDTDLCTGQFIAPNIVLTAGHCVFDDTKNTFYSVNNMTFVLQYQNGYGTQQFHVLCAATQTAYALPNNYSTLSTDQQFQANVNASQYDYAMLLVDANSASGNMGYQLDWKGHWNEATRVGYSGDVLNAKVIQQAPGIVFFADQIPLFTDNNGAALPYPGIVVHWQANPHLTQGTSGGAWIGNYSNAAGNNINLALSVTSFNLSGYPGAVFGPYLTSATFNSLLQYTKNGCK